MASKTIGDFRLWFGIELLAGELACVVAYTCLVAYCAKNFIFIADQDILVIIG